MKDKPLITVAIPNYNYGHYLRHCLDSVLNQTYSNFEVYFRDNKSTDESYEIALEYRKKFEKRGVYFNVSENKRNVGSDKNSQLAVRDYEGEFVYTLASDDAIKPEFLEKCVQVFLKHPNVGSVFVNREEIDEKGKITKTIPFYNQDCIIPGESQAAVYMMAGIGIPAQRMARLTILSKTKQYRRIWNVAGDWYENFLYAMAGDVAYLTEALVQYRVHSGNETSESERNLLGIFEHYQLLHSFVEVSKAFSMKKPAARYQEAVEKLGSMCLRYALKMLQNSENATAKRYLLLAPVFKSNIIEDPLYKKLTECTELKGDERNLKLTEIQTLGALSREISYDPPQDFIPLKL